jgi:uncharacterized protein YraI
MRRLTVLVLVALVAAACGRGGEVAGQDTTTTAPAETTTTAAPAETTTTAAETTTTAAPADPADLPGERVDIFPYEGDELAVVGVERGDELNLRAGPGVEFPVIAELAPLATGVVATGHNRSLAADGFWSEVRVDGQTGWANSRYLAHLGATRDATSELVGTGTPPQASSMEELARQVGDPLIADDTEGTAEAVIVDGPHQGDLAEIVVDVVGLPDDSVLGERLHLFAIRDGSAFILRTIEATTLCRRGVTAEGLCV